MAVCFRYFPLVRYISLHFHMKVILYPKFRNLLHHRGRMMLIKSLPVFPAVNQQYRFWIYHWEKIVIPQITRFFADCRSGSAAFHLFRKFSCITICTGIIDIHNYAHFYFLHSRTGSVKSTSMFFITNLIFSRITPLFQKKKQ